MIRSPVARKQLVAVGVRPILRMIQVDLTVTI